MDESRIEQFRKMTEADPDNELGHFSLGRAYADAGRHGEAVRSFKRVLELNSGNTKAYHLLGQAQIESGDRAGAVGTLRRGLEVASARGDMQPRAEMASMLRGMGEAVPDMPEAKAAPTQAGAGGQIVCRRCGQPAAKMPERPFKGPLGEQVWASVCSTCWQQWIRMGTKVINEMRLDFANPRHSAVYDEHMKEFLNLA